jgi:hypothetical protein
MKKTKKLKELYDRILKFQCIPGCTECCGPVALIKTERKRLKLDINMTPIKQGSLECVFATSEGCKIYDDRPMTCRLFGVVESLLCPRGCRPNKNLQKNKKLKL